MHSETEHIETNKKRVTEVPHRASRNALEAPALRFKEFDGGWRKEPIGKHINLSSGLAFKGEDISEDPSGVPILRGINITEGFIRHNEKIDRYFLGDASKLDKIRVKEGDLVLGMDGSKVGKNSALVSKVDVDSLLIQRVARLREKKGSCLAFIYQHINSIRFHKYVDVVNTSSGIPHISSKQINDFRILFPNEVQEQQKIASFLSAVDEKIQLLTKKKALLEHYKKGVMQQLFSGKLRFKDVDGKDFPDWEEKRLGSFCSFFSGGTPSSTNKDYYQGTIPFIGSGNIYDSEVFSFISEEAFNSSSAKIVLEGDLLYALYGANSGEVAISKIEGAINQAILCIRTKESIEYLYYILLGNKDSIVAKYLQGGQGNLSAQIIKKLKYKFPSIKEQQKIAAYLSSIDTKIERVNQQITQTQTFKKGLLQQMFV